MSLRSVAALAALLAAAATPALDLPPMPRPEEGYLALWDWLRTVNAELSIPDSEFRLMFGGFSIPILLLFEIVGMRKDWKLWPFLVPFWLIFGSIGLGVLAGVGLTAAHLVLFPAGRIYFILRNRRRAAGEGPRAAPARAEVTRAEAPTGGAPRAPRGVREALAMVRELAEKARAAAERERMAKEQRVPAPDRLHAPWPEAPPATPARTAPLPPGVPGPPDLGRFKPDLSRFRRRPKG